MSSTIGSVRRVICDFVAPSRIVSDSGQQVVALDVLPRVAKQQLQILHKLSE